MELPTSWNQIDDFDGADFNQPVAVARIDPGRFRVQHDFARHDLASPMVRFSAPVRTASQQSHLRYARNGRSRVR